MGREELAGKIIEFVHTQDGETYDEWYTTERDIADLVLTRFAEYIGLEVVIPEHIPVKTRRKVNLERQRKEIFREMLPDLEELFNLRYKEITEKDKYEQQNQDPCGND